MIRFIKLNFLINKIIQETKWEYNIQTTEGKKGKKPKKPI